MTNSATIFTRLRLILSLILMVIVSGFAFRDHKDKNKPDLYDKFEEVTDKMGSAIIVSKTSPEETLIIPSSGRSDTLPVLFRFENHDYYAIPFKTGKEGGYLFWCFSTNDSKIDGWYMAYKKLKKQRSYQKHKDKRFFRYYEMKKFNLTDKPGSEAVWSNGLVQYSDIKLEADTEYYIWFSSNATKPGTDTNKLAIYYAMTLTDNYIRTNSKFLKENYERLQYRSPN